MTRSMATKGVYLSALREHYSPPSGALPLGRSIALARGRVHEVMGDSSDAFALIIAAMTHGPVVWIGRHGDVVSLAPMAIRHFFDPSRLILTTCISRDEILWASEQALRMKGAGLVVTQIDLGPNLTESRRLQLAAEQGGTLGLILIDKHAQSSAAQTRWQCNPLPTIEETTNNNPYRDEWIFTLTKNKAGPIGRWSACWRSEKHRDDDAPCSLHMAAMPTA